MLNDYCSYHGLVFIEILNKTRLPIKLQVYPSPSNASYAINDEVGIYIKYSTKRLSPWRFSFLKEHKLEILEMKTILQEVFVILVCHDDGIVCLNTQELQYLLSDSHSEDTDWISASRSKREKYAVAGTNGKLKVKIGNSDFPKKVIEKLSQIEHKQS